MCRFDKKNHKKKKFPQIFLLKSTFKVALQYLYVVILFNTVIYVKINFKLRINPKVFIFKNLEEI